MFYVKFSFALFDSQCMHILQTSKSPQLLEAVNIFLTIMVRSDISYSASEVKGHIVLTGMNALVSNRTFEISKCDTLGMFLF